MLSGSAGEVYKDRQSARHNSPKIEAPPGSGRETHDPSIRNMPCLSRMFFLLLDRSKVVIDVNQRILLFAFLFLPFFFYFIFIFRFLSIVDCCYKY